MRRMSGWIPALLLGAAALASALPARAQARPEDRDGRARRSPYGQPYSGPGSPSRFPAPGTGTADTLPRLLLERDFQYMRATSPNPDSFLGGRYNPLPQSRFPRNRFGGVYGGIVTPYFYGGFYYFPPQSYIEREVIILRDAAAALQQNGDAAGRPGDGRPAAPRAEPRSEQPPADAPPGDDFYLGRRQAGESLSDALDDIRKAWLNGDFPRMQARFPREGSIRIYPGGRYRYSVEAREFLAVIQDAMTVIDTLAFELERPTAEEAGRVFVAGKHTYVDGAGQKQEKYVSYRLEKLDGRWKITGAGSSSSPIQRHTE